MSATTTATETTCRTCGGHLRLVNAGPDEWSHDERADHDPVPVPTTSAAARAAFEAQGECPPGTPAFWKLWGAQVRHIRTGDIVGTLEDGELVLDLIQDTFEAKAAPLRRGFVIDGEKITLGALVPVVVLRWGTHHTLVD